MTTLDFLPGKIPLSAFAPLCPGSHRRPIPVMIGGYVTRYVCSECATTFTAAEVGHVARVAPGHRERVGE